MSTYPLAHKPSYSDEARQIMAQLELRLSAVAKAVRMSEVWKTVTSPASDRDLVIATLREVMLSVGWYQGHTTDAGFTMIGRLPKSAADNALLLALLKHKAEEAEHNEWACRDFVLLGGEARRVHEPTGPAEFAVAGVWDRLARTEDPYGYLGAEYLFECLTMQIGPDVMEACKLHKIPAEQVGFLKEHAVLDIGHANLLSHWIMDTVTRKPSTGASMLRAFDYFAAVYPLPVWADALARARSLATVA